MPNTLRQFKKAEDLPEVNPTIEDHIYSRLSDSHDPLAPTSTVGIYEPDLPVSPTITVEVSHA